MNHHDTLPVEGKPRFSRFLEKTTYGLLLALVFLLPIFFLPSLAAPFVFTKTIIMIVLVAIAFIFYAGLRLKQGNMVIPKGSLIISFAILPIVYLLSGIFSGAPGISLLGQGESATFGFVFFATIAGLLFALTAVSRERLFYPYLALVASIIVLALFHIARLIFGADFMDFGLFTDITASLAGKWNDSGVLFGLVALLSLITLESLNPRRGIKVLLYIGFILSLVLLAFVGFSTVWYVLAAAGLVLFVYFAVVRGGDVSPATESGKKIRISFLSLALLIISIGFMLGGGSMLRGISEKLGIQYVEVRPSWGATLDLTADALAKDPVFGIGSNRFNIAWAMNKPLEVNTSAFWNTDFAFGIGYIPSLAVMLGGLGILAFLAFLGIFIYKGFGGVFMKDHDPVTRYILTGSFVVALYLWFFAFFYVPSSSLLFLAFAFTGITIGALMMVGKVPQVRLQFADEPRKGFAAILGIVILGITTIGLLYVYVGRYAAAWKFEKARVAIGIDGDVTKAEAYLTAAIANSPSDIYLRNKVEIDLVKMNAVLANTAKSPDEMRSEFQTLLTGAIESARQAITYDSSEDMNWQTLGRVYEAVLPLGIEGAYDNAKAAYDAAILRSPTNPAIYLAKARLEFANENYEASRAEIAKALELKSNYTEAIFLLAQTDIEEGNIKGAIRSVEAAAYIAPNDPLVFFQLGILRYSDKNFAGARDAFAQAITLNNLYANARYYLGLSLYELDDIEGAIREFEFIKQYNPDNADVEQIIANLKAGKAPIATTPSTLPVKER